MRSLIDLYLFCFQVFTSALILFFKHITDKASFHNLFSQSNHFNRPLRIREGDFGLLVKHLLNRGVFTWFSYTSLNNSLTEARCTSDILLDPFLSPYRLISSY